MSKILILGVISVIVVAPFQFIPELAKAQSDENLFARNRNVSVKERSHPEYESNGMQYGIFTYKPELNTGLEYDNNIYATQTNKISDGIAILNPSLDVESIWAVHSLRGSASLERREYFEYETESVTNYDLAVDGRLDVTRLASLEAGASYRKTHDPRTSNGAVNRAAEPILSHVTGAYVGGAYETGRIKFSGQVSLDSYDYKDVPLIGGTADQDFRDQDETNFEGRAAYAISPTTAIFARVRHQDQVYSNSGAIERDQSGSVLDVGADFDLTNLVRGEVGVGYLDRSFENPAFDNVNGVSFSGNVEWFATPLITVSASGDRSARAAAIATSPAYVATDFGGNVDYEFRRNIILSAGATYGTENYDGIDRLDKRGSTYLGANYLLNRNVGVYVNLSKTNLKSAGVDRQSSFDGVKAMVGVTLRR